MSLTNRERRLITAALDGYVGPIDGVFWAYLALCVDRVLTDADREAIRVEFLGHKPAGTVQ